MDQQRPSVCFCLASRSGQEIKLYLKNWETIKLFFHYSIQNHMTQQNKATKRKTLTQPLNTKNEQRKPTDKQTAAAAHTLCNPPYLISRCAFKQHVGVQTRPKKRYDGPQLYIRPLQKETATSPDHCSGRTKYSQEVLHPLHHHNDALPPNMAAARQQGPQYI